MYENLLLALGGTVLHALIIIGLYRWWLAGEVTWVLILGTLYAIMSVMVRFYLLCKADGLS